MNIRPSSTHLLHLLVWRLASRSNVFKKRPVLSQFALPSLQWRYMMRIEDDGEMRVATASKTTTRGRHSATTDAKQYISLVSMQMMIIIMISSSPWLWFWSSSLCEIIIVINAITFINIYALIGNSRTPVPYTSHHTLGRSSSSFCCSSAF